MKKVVCAVLMIVALLAGMCAYASGFSQDPDRIEQAAKSVLMLKMYDQRGNIIKRGSGFVAFDSGTLVTNYHVINDAYEIYAVSDDDKSYMVTKVLCADEELDIAILGFEKKTSLEPLTLWADRNLKRGAPVVAIGSPMGRKNTVSKGEISAIYADANISEIQFTAPISHGSSGGALFNDDGKVIGVTTAILEAESQNINLAVPSAVVKAMYQAWDGRVYTVRNHKSSAKLDYSGVYDESTEATAVDTADSDALSEVWSCPDCGNKNNSQFCLECGREKPSWKCRCGLVNHGKFCGSCGSSLQKLLGEMNGALLNIDDGKYDLAIEALSELGAFNCLTMESKVGKNCAAEVQLQRAYYLRAEQKLAVYNFKQAYEDFIHAGPYMDAASRQYEVFYQQALYQKEHGAYEAAMQSFETAAQAYDVTNELLECHYRLAKQYADEGRFDDARKEYGLCGDYLDARACILQTYYAQGNELLEKGSYSEAIAAFEKAGDVWDARERILAAYYEQAENAYSQGKNEEAIALFTKAGSYSDAEARIREVKERDLEAKYAAAEEKYAKKEYAVAAEAFWKIVDYRDARERMKQCYYCHGEEAEKKGKYEKASEYFGNAGDYLDAADRQYEVLCDYAEKLRNASPQKARAQLKGLNYDRARKLYVEITYEEAEKSYTKGDWESAVSLYEECLDYMDSLEKMKTANQALILWRLEQGNLRGARTQFENLKSQPWAAGDFVIAEPGGEGKMVTELLCVAKAMGLLGWYPDGEQAYKDKYKASILKMEACLELEADGVVHCSEYLRIMETIVPGSKGEEVRKLLEYISDLGYFDALGVLPDKHDTYESRYQYSIKRLETDLKLKVDGFLTTEEVAAIKKQRVSVPEDIAKLTLTQNKSVVFLTWTPAKGAKWYEVYRNGVKIATVKGTNYTDKEAVQGQYNRYTVRACKYTKYRERKEEILVERSYIKTTCTMIAKDYNNYNGKYVELNKTKVTSTRVVGSDYYIMVCEKMNGKTYYAVLVLSGYRNWKWDDKNSMNSISKMTMAGGKGRVYKRENSMTYIDMNSISWSY